MRTGEGGPLLRTRTEPSVNRGVRWAWGHVWSTPTLSPQASRLTRSPKAASWIARATRTDERQAWSKPYMSMDHRVGTDFTLCVFRDPVRIRITSQRTVFSAPALGTPRLLCVFDEFL